MEWCLYVGPFEWFAGGVMTFLKGLLGGLAILSLLGGPQGCGVFDFKPKQKSSDDIPPSDTPTAKAEMVDNYAWSSLPDWVQPSLNAGLVGEAAAPELNVPMRAVQVTWRQINPDNPDDPDYPDNPKTGVFSQTGTGHAEDISMRSLADQLADGGPFWMRIWASGIDWAPQWVINKCNVSAIGTDYNGEGHLPLWNSCVWEEYLKMMRQVFIGWDLRSNPDFRFLWVPGGFAWCEFDFEVITQAANNGLTFSTFNSWFQQAMYDLANIFNGENQDPADDQANKLVYTGKDYPNGPWGTDGDGLALDAVTQGMGIRISNAELFNYHNNQLPSCGTRITSDGHVEIDESALIRQNGRLVVAELTCFNDCGYTTNDTEYAVRLAALKALQLRVDYLHVLPLHSYIEVYPALWNYVRLSLGKKPADSPDAWVVLREYEDTFWTTDTTVSWTGSPWLKNMERFLVQRDVTPNGVSQPGSEQKDQVWDARNGRSYEGRKTNHQSGSDFLYFDINDQFLNQASVPVKLQITYLDEGDNAWWVEYAGKEGHKRTESVMNENSGQKKTVQFVIQDGWFDNSLPGGTDFYIYNGGAGDVEIYFVWLIKQQAP